MKTIQDVIAKIEASGDYKVCASNTVQAKYTVWYKPGSDDGHASVLSLVDLVVWAKRLEEVV